MNMMLFVLAALFSLTSAQESCSIECGCSGQTVCFRESTLCVVSVVSLINSGATCGPCPPTVSRPLCVGQGQHVAIGGDVLLVGAPYDDDVTTSTGSAYVFSGILNPVHELKSRN